MKRLLLPGFVFVMACGVAPKQEPQKVPLTFQAQLDSGNAAYRRHEYTASTKFFHEAAKTDPQNLSGWYGIYMAESKLGNSAEANRARAIVAKQAPTMPITQHENPHGGKNEQPKAK